MLSRGVSYNTIVKETGLSSTTVARISKWLKKGAGGYKIILKRLSSSGNHHRNPNLAAKGLR
jgi:uncharacterized protein YerC